MTIDKGIGFNRTIFLRWLDAAAEARLQNETISAMRERLEVVISLDLKGVDARRKTIDLLVNIWHKTVLVNADLHLQALEFLPLISLSERVWLHYGLILLYYPFFRQTTAIVGQSARTGEPVTRLAVKNRLAKEIGHLGSLNRAAERVIASLVDWGALAYQKKGNVYLPQLKAFSTRNDDLQTWLLLCALSAHPSEQIPFSDLIRLPELFPMDLSINLDVLRKHPNFNVQRQGIWDMVSVSKVE